MAFEDDFRARVLADSDIATLVSTRVYPLVDLGKELPSMVYTVGDGVPEVPFTGTRAAPSYDVQLDYYTTTYSDLQTVRDSLLSSFNGFTGEMGDTVVRWSRVDSTFQQLDQSDGHTFRLTTQLTIVTA